jgi:hypothetical protein
MSDIPARGSRPGCYSPAERPNPTLHYLPYAYKDGGRRSALSLCTIPGPYGLFCQHEL